MFGKLLRQLGFMLKRRRSERDLDREIRFHIEMETLDRVENGMTEPEARRTALADFGSIPACQETTREAWGLRIWSDLRRDFQYSIRMIRRRPGMALLAVLTLAAGIGANTAVFSVFDAALLKPLPYHDPERLEHLWETRNNQDFAQMELSYPNFQDWKQRNHSFDDLAGYNGTNFTLTGIGVPVRVSATGVTANMLSVLGVQPEIGRGFTTDEEAIDKSHVAILTHGFWRSQLGGRPDALGETLRLNGVPYTIVGILPADFFLMDGDTQMLVPLAAPRNQLDMRQFHWVHTVGRLKQNVTHEEAEADLKAIAAQLAAEYPATNAGTSARLVRLHEQIVGGMRMALAVIFGAAACMLCLAFVNLANLMIAQSSTRLRELAIRRALGAGTMRLGRQLMAECMVLATIGGAVAIVVARWTLRGILLSMPPTLVAHFPLMMNSHIDGRVLFFAIALTLIGGFFAGSVVVFRLSRNSLRDAMITRVRAIFTSAEVALAVMLLVGAVVMIESVQRLMQVDPGFKTANLLVTQLSLPGSRFPKSQNVADFYAELQQRAASLPGVEKAAVIDELPLTTDGGTVYVIPSSRPETPLGEQQETVIRGASPNYFETMGIPLKNGRTFTNTDRPNSSNVVILSETLAQKLFGNADPVGQRVITTFNKKEWDVVGVVGDVRLANLDAGIRPTIYTCSLQDPSRNSVLVLRTTAAVDSVVSLVRAQVQSMDSELPVYGARSIADTIDRTPGVATRKLVLYLVGTFSSIGVLMAGIGLYGLMSFVVVQRSKEIGIRIALGANKQNVRSLILRPAMLTTAAGLVAGIAIAIAGERLMQSVIFGVTPSSPSVLAIVVSLVAAITFIACSVPVRRAVRTDPIVVLRHD